MQACLSRFQSVSGASCIPGEGASRGARLRTTLVFAECPLPTEEASIGRTMRGVCFDPVRSAQFGH